MRRPGGRNAGSPTNGESTTWAALAPTGAVSSRAAGTASWARFGRCGPPDRPAQGLGAGGAPQRRSGRGRPTPPPSSRWRPTIRRTAPPPPVRLPSPSTQRPAARCSTGPDRALVGVEERQPAEQPHQTEDPDGGGNDEGAQAVD